MQEAGRQAGCLTGVAATALVVRAKLLEAPVLGGYALYKRKGESFGGKDQWNAIYTQTTER